MTEPLLVVCGSRRDPSRTRALADHVAEYAREIGIEVKTLDLREHPMELFDGRELSAYDDPTQHAVESFLDAKRYVIASPVYFGGLSGTLKNLIDHIPYETFQKSSRTAGLVMNGRDERHRHVLDSQLRATMVYLGVDVPTTSVFATEADFDEWRLTTPAVRDQIETLVDDTRALHGQ
jgi:NAD(P)H-dependent FMN reductase